MAPEMLFKSAYDYRVDIWALGINAYLLITKNFPFKLTLFDKKLINRISETVENQRTDLKDQENIDLCKSPDLAILMDSRKEVIKIIN